MAASEADPLTLLQEDLRDEDIELVVQSAGRIAAVARSLGAEKTRGPLLTFLREYLEEDNDEAHATVAKQLAEFLPLVGGPAYGKLLLPLLEKLCAEEEVVVRDAAVNAINQLVPQLKKDDIKDVVAMITRLSGSPWFATRVSAAGIVPSTYGAATDAGLQDELRKIFKTLCGDETPMVRRASYLRLAEFANHTRPHFLSDILPIIKKICADPADTMRVLTVDIICVVADFLPKDVFETHLVGIIEALEDDVSWRVRQTLVKKMAKFCKHVTPAVASTKLIPLFVKILKDKEPEVRSTAAAMMAEVGNDVKGSESLIAPCLETLAADPVQSVRIKVATSMIHLCKRFAKEPCTKIVIPLIKQLAKDENFEVRSTVISEIDKLAEFVDPSALSSVFPLMVELSKDAKWRVRAAVIDKSSVLARHLGPKKFEKQLQSIVLSALSDHVFAIRERACVQMGLIVKAFGGKWAAEKLFPTAFAIYDRQANYLYRMTCLLLIQHVTSECTPDIIEKQILPIVLSAAADDVPNVRIAAGKTIGALIPRIDPKLVKGKLTPVLQKLSKDSDPDVIYFSSKTLKDFKHIVY